MKLKIFDCKSKYAMIVRICVCALGLLSVAALSCAYALDDVMNGFIEELLIRVGLMSC